MKSQAARISSSLNDGTVFTAGSKITSAPASINLPIAFKSTSGSSTPAECIFPAMIKPEKYFLAFFIALAIDSFVTPVPGLPVRQTKLKPSCWAFLKVSALAILPVGIRKRSSIIFASGSTGSKLQPTGRPISFFNKATGFPSVTTPAILGLLQSKTFNKHKSLPKAAASSGFETSPSNGLTAITFSLIITRPSQALIDCFNSSPFIASFSLAVQFNNLFISNLHYFYYNISRNKEKEITKNQKTCLFKRHHYNSNCSAELIHR